MDVLARTLSVHNYRSFKEFDVELDPDITILIGRNAVGKTNLIAVSYTHLTLPTICSV